MPYLLPAITADGIHAATVTRWLKRQGDRVRSRRMGSSELEAEEAIVLIEAAEAGTLAEILVQPGHTVAVGAMLAPHRIPAFIATCRGNTYGTTHRRRKACPQRIPQAAAGKVIPILMPQAGNTMEEGTSPVLAREGGDQIKVGQVICEIETDKATIDFESPDGGRLARIVATPGQSVAGERADRALGR